jgi:hypothetical protein
LLQTQIKSFPINSRKSQEKDIQPFASEAQMAGGFLHGNGFVSMAKPVELLRKIHPNLIVKQRQAKWILRFADYKANQQKLGNIDKQKIAQFGIQCGKKIRALNSRQRNKRLLKSLKLKNDYLSLASEHSLKYVPTVPFEEIKRRLQRLRSFRNN